jgi:cation transport ATPase
MSNELFRDEQRDQEDIQKLRALQREQRINLKAFLMTIGVVIAPFLALLFSVEAALFVLAMGLAFTIWVTWSGASMVGPVQRSRLKTMAVMNAIIMLAVLGILALRLSS